MTDQNNRNRLYLVIPCYNEEEVLPATARELALAMSSMIQSTLISPDSKIVFVDDGSKDGTWALIEHLSKTDPMFGGIALGRNVGHQNALYAGLMTVRDFCDLTISMDADLQDDPELLPQMVQEYLAGHDIVCTVRKDRDCDSFFKKTSADLFYRTLKLLGVTLPKHGADFRLLSRKALEKLNEFEEHDPFLRGIIPMLGLPTTVLSFDRKPRMCGESKYSMKRMVSLASDGIFSLSRRPLDLIFLIGFLCFVPSFLWLLFHLLSPIGFDTLLASLWAIGGLILIAVGIVGQYVGRIHTETLNRPRYTIRDKQNLNSQDPSEPDQISAPFL